MLIREPVVAGRFYPASPDRCRDELAACLPADPQALPPNQRVFGGIVPHAGWICSGSVAGLVIDAVARSRPPQTAVIFGAVHVRGVQHAAVFSSGIWETPVGPIPVNQRLAERICESSALIESDPTVHEYEHSIEVQLPFLRHVAPDIQIVPIMVAPDAQSHVVGRIVARTCMDSNADVVFLGSTDLTHYGPGYDFTPQGVGPTGLQWAKDHNDRRMIDTILRMDAEAVVTEARANQNACGSGAIAATIAACRQAGATQARLLRHTTSYEVLSRIGHESPTDAVGYAAIVFI
ncbi:MAG: AmmeMemoRadiSam system protein B [Phycisphaerae bacterium]|nr:AmmeMemoRadiSam system protein B [Phycisphaerae bacterium]